jgi:hypothetical protein
LGTLNFSFVVFGTGQQDMLQFAGRNPGALYVLDDVAVTPTFEPSTLSLFGLGLLLGAHYSRARRKGCSMAFRPEANGEACQLSA